MARTKARSRKKPGRPEGLTNYREQILEAASELFAGRGYAGVPLREIAARAGVTTALITYYFGSKETLLETIMMNYGEALAENRRRNLARLQADGGQPSVRQIVTALLEPLVGLPKSQASLRFLKIQAWLHNEPEEFAYVLRGKLYDRTNQEFVAALQKAMPHIDPRTVYWRFVLSVGSYIYLTADPKRLVQISNGVCDTSNSDELLYQTTEFIVGGLTAPDPGRPATAGDHPTDILPAAPPRSHGAKVS